MKTKKMNNKGFSIVELIVVIAIMAILAVTLAPRLTHYIERSRVASDQEAVNTIYTAAKLANAEYPLEINQAIPLGGVAGTALFTISADGKEWNLNTAYSGTDFFNAMEASLTKFKLKSNSVGSFTQITLKTDANGLIKLELDYNLADTNTVPNYEVAE